MLLNFSDGATLRIPVHTTVRNFSLVDVPPEIPYGFLGLSPMLPSTPFPEAAALDRTALAASLQRLRALGVTGLSGGLGGPRITGYTAAGTIAMDFSAADATMDAVHAVFGNTSGTVLNSYFGMTLQGMSCAPGLAAGWWVDEQNQTPLARVDNWVGPLALALMRMACAVHRRLQGYRRPALRGRRHQQGLPTNARTTRCWMTP